MKGSELKGIVFSQFLEMVDENFGHDVTEHIIAASDLPSGGAYTSVGTYDHEEIISLVGNLSHISGVKVQELVISFGHYLIKNFQIIFPKYFVEIDNALELLENVNDYIHVEVRKLYQDAQLPKISTQRTLDDGLILTYKSKRGMGDLAQGMIEGVIDIYGSKYTCDRIDLEKEGDLQCIQFNIVKKQQ